MEYAQQQSYFCWIFSSRRKGYAQSTTPRWKLSIHPPLELKDCEWELRVGRWPMFFSRPELRYRSYAFQFCVSIKVDNHLTLWYPPVHWIANTGGLCKFWYPTHPWPPGSILQSWFLWAYQIAGAHMCLWVEESGKIPAADYSEQMFGHPEPVSWTSKNPDLWSIKLAYSLSRDFMQISIMVGQVVNPASHKILRKQHWHGCFSDQGQCLSENLKSPILPLGGRSSGEQRLCSSLATYHHITQFCDAPSTTIRYNSWKPPSDPECDKQRFRMISQT